MSNSAAPGGDPHHRAPRGRVRQGLDLGMVDRVQRALGDALAAVFLLIAAVIAYEVVARYAFGAPTIWAHELTATLTAVAFLFGGPYALTRGEHIRITSLYRLFSPRWRRLADIFACLVTLFYIGCLIYAAWIVADRAWARMETSASAWNQPTPVLVKSALQTIVPPSIVLIIYGLTANVDIGGLFLASLLPGLLLAGLYSAYLLLRCHLDPEAGPAASEAERRISRSEKWRLARGLILPCLVIVWVLGTIYGGIASVSEAAAMGVIGAAASALVRGELTWRMLRDALRRTMSTSGLLLWSTIGANALIGVYNLLGGSRFVQQSITGLALEPLGVILLMMLILIVLGLFIDWIGIVLLTMPIFVPIVESLGYSAVWFGVLFCMNMQISYLSPPFGPACFYLKSVVPPDVELGEIFRAMWPFIALQAIGLLPVLFIPGIALWLPGIT